jgi:hypothetical protein
MSSLLHSLETSVRSTAILYKEASDVFMKSSAAHETLQHAIWRGGELIADSRWELEIYSWYFSSTKERVPLYLGQQHRQPQNCVSCKMIILP